MRNWIERHQVLAVALAAGLAYLAWVLKDVLIVLFIGYILAAALRPAVDWLERHLVPRVIAILILYVVFFAALGWLFASSLPQFVAQTQSFGARLTELSHQLTRQIPFFGPDQLANLVAYLQQQAAQVAAASLAVVVGLVSSVIISIYLLYDWHRIHKRGEGQASRTLLDAAHDSELALGAWVRGQVILSAAVGILSFFALIALGVEFAPVLAVLAFIFEFVPYAGPFLGGAPAVLIALNQSSTTALLVIIAYTVIQQIEAHVLVPLIMRRAVNLHPVIVIAVMLTGLEILGLPGVLLAVPVAVVVRVGWARFWHA
jgi:predicted PurR-regulated permease PerM